MPQVCPFEWKIWVLYAQLIAITLLSHAKQLETWPQTHSGFSMRCYVAFERSLNHSHMLHSSWVAATHSKVALITGTNVCNKMRQTHTNSGAGCTKHSHTKLFDRSTWRRGQQSPWNMAAYIQWLRILVHKIRWFGRKLNTYFKKQVVIVHRANNMYIYYIF